MLNKRYLWRKIIRYTVKIKHLTSFHSQVYGLESLGFSFQGMLSNAVNLRKIWI